MKLFKRILSIFLSIFLLNILFLSKPAYCEPDCEAYLVQDNDRLDSLPDNLRTTSKIRCLKDYPDLDLTGLKELHISGSAQFSQYGLYLLKNYIVDKNYPVLIDIDLRQETHGFINGLPISIPETNVGLNVKDTVKNEDTFLNSIELGKKIKFQNRLIKIKPVEVANEYTVSKNNSVIYIRFSVQDNKLPNEETVEDFIKFVNTQPKNTAVHFHCKAGIGRTTIFMIMYDIMKNYKDVSIDDIIKRQVILSGMDEDNANSFYSGERYNFLNNFYNTYSENN